MYILAQYYILLFRTIKIEYIFNNCIDNILIVFGV